MKTTENKQLEELQNDIRSLQQDLIEKDQTILQLESQMKSPIVPPTQGNRADGKVFPLGKLDGNQAVHERIVDPFR
jgi:hypothetical protein